MVENLFLDGSINNETLDKSYESMKDMVDVIGVKAGNFTYNIDNLLRFDITDDLNGIDIDPFKRFIC